MQENLNVRKNHIGRKIVIIVFLPIITLIWTIGWILTQIGSPGKTSDIRTKTSPTHSELKVNNKESKIADENDNEPRPRYEHEISA